MSNRRFPSPPHAHVPGRTPRHPENAFAALHASVRSGLDAAELARCDAWAAGWQFFDDGFFWEAHEVWEPVWMALTDGTDDRQMAQAAIQTANAALKLRMERPRAVLRLCDIVGDLVRGLGSKTVMRTDPLALVQRTQEIRRAANLMIADKMDVHNNA